MIPLRDNIPHRKLPFIAVSLIIINVLVFLYELGLGEYLENFIHIYGFIPKKLFLDVSWQERITPLVTSMFLHGSLMHLIGNMLFIWIFADNVEDRLGHYRFLLFYLICGVLASLVHTFFNLNSKIPTVGASGAIAGVLGAYFMMFPQAKVSTLIPFFLFCQVIEIPAFFFLGIWFVYQFMLGIGSMGSHGSGIAFWAHIGGFVGGILLVKLFQKRRYKRRE